MSQNKKLKRNATSTTDVVAEVALRALPTSTRSLFSLPEFPKEERGLAKLDWSCGVTGRVNIIQSIFSSKFRVS